MMPKFTVFAMPRISLGDMPLFHAEDEARRKRMDIEPVLEGLDEMAVTRKVRKYPELDLGIIRRQKHVIFRRRNERLPYAPALFGLDRDVLQVRLARREPARRCDRLVE